MEYWNLIKTNTHTTARKSKDHPQNQHWKKNAHLRVLSQLPETNIFISGIQATWDTAISCIATVCGWLPPNGHIFTCLSQPPLKTVDPSSFHAEHKTFQKKHSKSSAKAQLNKIKTRLSKYQSTGRSWFYRLIMSNRCLCHRANWCSIFRYLPTSHLQ